MVQKIVNKLVARIGAVMSEIMIKDDASAANGGAGNLFFKTLQVVTVAIVLS